MSEEELNPYEAPRVREEIYDGKSKRGCLEMFLGCFVVGCVIPLVFLVILLVLTGIW